MTVLLSFIFNYMEIFPVRNLSINHHALNTPGAL